MRGDEVRSADESRAFDPHSLPLDEGRDRLEEAFLAVVGDSARGTTCRVFDHEVATMTHMRNRFRAVDPVAAAAMAVAESTRTMTCLGAIPLVATDCLNFETQGSPETRDGFFDAARGIASACEAMGLPLISGSTDVPADAPSGASWPTPLVGMMGRLARRTPVGEGFAGEGDVIVLLGDTDDELGCSRYLSVRFGRESGPAPAVDLASEQSIEAVVRECIARGLVSSARACSDGGLATALASCCVPSGVGCRVEMDDDLPPAASLFSETQARILISVRPRDSDTIADLFDAADIAYAALGTTGGDRVVIVDEHERPLVDLPLSRVGIVGAGAANA